MKKIAILYKKYSPLIDAIKYQLSDCEIDCLTSPKDMEKYDLVILSDYEENYSGSYIKCHRSLLPAFDCKNPEEEAVLQGVKVTGITILYVNPKKIIAQYPLFINNNTHFDELKQELIYLEQTLFPIVLKKIIHNEVFEIRSLINNDCSRNCGGCSSCSH